MIRKSTYVKYVGVREPVGEEWIVRMCENEVGFKRLEPPRGLLLLRIFWRDLDGSWGGLGRHGEDRRINGDKSGMVRHRLRLIYK